MTRIISPLSVAILGLLGGVAAGLSWFWVRADCMVEVAQARPRAADSSAGKAKEWDFWSVEIDNLASELKDEKLRVKKQEADVGLRSVRLASDRQELEKLRTDLTAMRKDISDKVVEVQADEAKNLRMLAQTYANLTPHSAVTIIRDLDDAMAVKILSLMKPDIVGPIFEDMAQSDPSTGDAHRAAVLSDKLRMVKAQKTAEAQ